MTALLLFAVVTAKYWAIELGTPFSAAPERFAMVGAVDGLVVVVVARGHRAAGRAPLGGSNRLLSVDELAAFLGVPKKTFGTPQAGVFMALSAAGVVAVTLR